MALAATIVRLRQAANTIAAFQATHILDTDTADKLYEFDVLLELVEKIRQATGIVATVKVGPRGAFARNPGLRANFNWIQQGAFRIDFGTMFPGLSGATHAPDISLTHNQLPDRVVVAFECKYYASPNIDKGLVMAFAATLIDLGRPVFPDARGHDIIPAPRLAGPPPPPALAAPADAGHLVAALQDGRSYLVTSSQHASAGEQRIAARYGFEIRVKQLL